MLSSLWLIVCLLPLAIFGFKFGGHSFHLPTPSFALRKDLNEVEKAYDRGRKETRSFVSSLLKGRDDKIELLDKLVAAKDELITLTKVDALRTRGLLNARKVFELLLTLCHSEIWNFFKDEESIAKKDKLSLKFNATETISALIALKEDELKQLPYCARLRSFANVSKLHEDKDLQKLYGLLSEEIHGLAWSGTVVRLYTDNLRPEQQTFLTMVANSFGLQVESKKSEEFV